MTHFLRKSLQKPVQYGTVNRLTIAQWSDCVCDDAHTFSNSTCNHIRTGDDRNGSCHVIEHIPLCLTSYTKKDHQPKLCISSDAFRRPKCECDGSRTASEPSFFTSVIQQLYKDCRSNLFGEPSNNRRIQTFVIHTRCANVPVQLCCCKADLTVQTQKGCRNDKPTFKYHSFEFL